MLQLLFFGLEVKGLDNGVKSCCEIIKRVGGKTKIRGKKKGKNASQPD